MTASAGKLVRWQIIERNAPVRNFYPDRAAVVLTGQHEFALPEIHAELRIAVARFFEQVAAALVAAGSAVHRATRARATHRATRARTTGPIALRPRMPAG